MLFVKRPWIKDAECRGADTNLFYPERGESTLEAKAICSTCPVKYDCGEYALEIGEKFGIWGGMSERERRKIRRARRLQRKKQALKQEELEAAAKRSDDMVE